MDEDVQTHLEFFFKNNKYRESLASLSLHNSKLLTVDFADLTEYDVELAQKMLEKPHETLDIMRKAAHNQLRIEDPEYAEQLEELQISVINLFEATPLRSLGAQDLHRLRMVKGICVKTTAVRPLLLKAAYECTRCGERQVILQTESKRIKPYKCQNPTCGRAGPFRFVKSESEWLNVQDVWIQETPEELPPGQLPRTLHIRAYDQLVNQVRPGDIVAVVGVLKPVEHKGTETILDTCFEANSITQLNKEPEATPETEELKKIKELSKEPWIHRKIIHSLAPAIYGYEEVKEAIMYMLFGGVPKEREGTRIRGEINILLVGDPGTGKTQLLKYVSTIAPRGLYCSGRGSSGVGLTAAVVRDPDTSEMSLEAGALVLADRGVVCIDEIDKMRPEDRVNIHEALESQTVSIAKGGIVATLNARTAVLAAANPMFGRYEAFRTIIENINLPSTLLSRFDLIFLMLDNPEDKALTKKIAEHVLALHRGATPEPPIPRQLLRKYIAYARQINPELTPEAAQLLSDFFQKAREKTGKTEGTLTEIWIRQLEALIRIAEARARAALRDKVLPEDAVAAINIVNRSLQQVGIDVSTGELDVNLILTGLPKSTREKLSTILSLIIEEERQTGLVDEKWLIDELETKYKIPTQEAKRLIAQLIKEGAIYEPREGKLKKT